MLGVVQVAFEGFGDAGAVAGGEQVEQQSAGDRDGEPGFCPRGLVIEPVAGGTRIRWAASWDRTLAGRLVQRSLRRVYPQIVAALAGAAEKQAAVVSG
jgi:hypothetical protein